MYDYVYPEVQASFVWCFGGKVNNTQTYINAGMCINMVEVWPNQLNKPLL